MFVLYHHHTPNGEGTVIEYEIQPLPPLPEFRGLYSCWKVPGSERPCDCSDLAVPDEAARRTAGSVDQ